MRDELVNRISNWLRAGAEINSGLLLFSQISSNKRIAALLRINSVKYRYILTNRLCLVAGLIAPQVVAPKHKFRDEFPFLRDHNCPPELKILASDKISAHERYLSAHDKLFDCVDISACYRTAREVIDNFLENRAIFEELDYYREHHSLLEKHPIFEQMRNLAELRKLKISELFIQKRRLTASIWRIDDEIKKNTKPHLQTERERRRAYKCAQLIEVEKFIAAYDVK